MKQKIYSGLKYLLGFDRPRGDLAVFPDDVFVVSFPKSGNTWTRFLIANLVRPEETANFGNINRIIPDPEALSRRDLKKISRPRIIKSHQPFDPRYKKVIYIVRDPRDVVVSQYHFHRKRRLIEDNLPIESFVTKFIAGDTSDYGSWGENVASWLATRQSSPSFLLLRYEDMMAETVRELTKIAVFLNIPPDLDLLINATHRSSAQEMRKLEQTQAHMWSSTKDTRSDIPFVRSAKAGGWKYELPQSSVAELYTAWGPLMNNLGYELSSANNRQIDSANSETLV